MRDIPKRAIIALIRLYAYIISPLLGSAKCRFYPSCSHYAQESVQTHGVFKGIILTIKRLAKCHPWHKGEMLDPVPSSIDWKDIIGYKPSVCCGACPKPSAPEKDQ